MPVELTPNQSKAFIDAEQAYRALQDAQEKARPYKGGMHWKTVHGKQYLYRTLDSKGRAKSLGPRDAETEALHAQFHSRRSELQARLISLESRLDEQTRMLRALRVGAAPRVLAKVCRALCAHDIMGKNVLIIGTNALYAYAAMAGVRLEEDITATSDMDMTFETTLAQPFKAINVDDDVVDQIDLPNMKWMLSAPTVRQFVVADNGTPFEMDVPDPRAFMLFKSWLSTQAEREPVKRGRDAAQAQAMFDLLKERLPQYPMDWAAFKAFPKRLIKTHEQLLGQNGKV